MQHVLSSQNICFIGAGPIVEAIIRGILQHHDMHDHITVTNRQNTTRLEELQHTLNVNIATTKEEKKQSISKADIVILGMKPHNVKEVVEEIEPYLSQKQLIISIVAGLSIASFQQLLHDRIPFIRTMPNTSSTIGLGVTGIAWSDEVTTEQRQLVKAMFEGIGIVKEIEEEQMHILTAIAGSAPAYVYYFMEAMLKGALDHGLDRQDALDMIVQTVIGAGQMVNITKEDPATLRKNVTSPKGITAAAIEKLDEGEFDYTIVSTIDRCVERSEEVEDMVNKINSTP
ncbi:pyrroline-5-carboxylate reductase [Longirhabdus pacifica]|uniref:pyrroline-5-carboxylate reductase n=1 Tax=Longirhabdus pacifica TaxID=2305227 RepID=UPI00100913AC|nr:pyrroline-5-carboxylate reductase [Longirhabdus pacifica]